MVAYKNKTGHLSFDRFVKCIEQNKREGLMVFEENDPSSTPREMKEDFLWSCGSQALDRRSESAQVRLNRRLARTLAAVPTFSVNSQGEEPTPQDQNMIDA